MVEVAAVDVPVVSDEKPRESAPDGPYFTEQEQDGEFELSRNKGQDQRRQDRQKRRQLVLDEKSGEVIAKRRRKGSRGSWDEEEWEDYDY